jgi:hypothetical protein
MVAPKHAGSPTHAVGNPAFVASKRAGTAGDDAAIAR